MSTSNPPSAIIWQDENTVYEATASQLLNEMALPQDYGQNELEARQATKKYLIHVLEYEPAPYQVIELKTMANVFYAGYLSALQARSGK